MNLFKKLAAGTLVVLAAVACSKENGVADGNESVVTFSINSPDIQTRSISDGNTVDHVHCCVYKEDGTYLDGVSKEVSMSGGKATFTTRLVSGRKYQFVFWADKSGNNFYTLDEANKKVTVKYDVENAANNEDRDAFYTHKEIEVKGNFSETVTLTRPFAQINFGVPQDDFTAAIAAGVNFDKSSVVAKNVANELNLWDDTVSGDVDASFSLANMPSEDLNVKIDGVETAYKYVAMNYVLIGKDKKYLSDVELTVYENDVEVNKVSAPGAPIQGNYRTNILGYLFTSQSVFNIIVDPLYNELTPETPDYIYNQLSLAFANGGEVALTEDVELTQGLVVPTGKSVVLDLGGNTISNTQDIWDESSSPKTVSLIAVDGGTLIIKGAGKISVKENDAYTFNVKDNGKLIIEDGEFVGNVSVVQVQEGTVEIKGGKFSLAQKWPSVGNGSEYLINLVDAARDAGTASAVVYGGTFENFDPSNNLAEGPNTNFVAAGYKSTKVGDYYVVAKDGESLSVSVSGQDELDHILANIPSEENTEINLSNGTYTLPETVKADGVRISGQTGDEVIDCASTTTVTAKNATITNVIVKGNGAVIDGSSLAMNGANATVKGCTFQNGRQSTYGSDISVSQSVGGTATISDSDFRKSGFRGIMIWNTGDEIKIDNCLFDNTYPFNCDAGNGKITVTNSELKGWTSYTSGLELVSFTNCTLGKSTSGYAYLVPYSKTVVKDCTFSADFCVSPSGSDAFTIEFINCKYEDGTPIDSNIMDNDPDNRNAQWIIDGTTYTY